MITEGTVLGQETLAQLTQYDPVVCQYRAFF